MRVTSRRASGTLKGVEELRPGQGGCGPERSSARPPPACHRCSAVTARPAVVATPSVPVPSRGRLPLKETSSTASRRGGGRSRSAAGAIIRGRALHQADDLPGLAVAAAQGRGGRRRPGAGPPPARADSRVLGRRGDRLAPGQGRVRRRDRVLAAVARPLPATAEGRHALGADIAHRGAALRVRPARTLAHRVGGHSIPAVDARRYSITFQNLAAAKPAQPADDRAWTFPLT